MAFKSTHLRKREPQFSILQFFIGKSQGIAVHSHVLGINEFELFHRLDMTMRKQKGR